MAKYFCSPIIVQTNINDGYEVIPAPELHERVRRS